MKEMDVLGKWVRVDICVKVFKIERKYRYLRGRVEGRRDLGGR